MLVSRKDCEASGALGITSLLITVLISSCQKEDRLAIVRCASPPRDTISVRVGLAELRLGASALVNTQQLLPGTLLEFRAAGPGETKGTGVPIYTLQSSDGDFSGPSPDAWLEPVVSAEFDIQADEDVDTELRSEKFDLTKEIARSTLILTPGVKRRSLRDPLSLINADRRAISLIEAASEGNRFGIIYAASYGRELSLTNYGTSLAVDIVSAPRFYLHLKYTCAAVATINSQVASLGADVPIVVFVMPIKANRVNHLVEVDTIPLDMSKMHIGQN